MSLVQTYHRAKNAWSEAYALTNQHERAPLVRAYNVQEAADYIAKLPYTEDPLGGLVDFYQHPERVAYHVEKGTIIRLRMDCDEILLAYAMLLGGGSNPQLLVLIDGGGIKWTNGRPYVWHHVIVRCDQGADVCTIDVGGRLIHHESEAAILKRFGEFYPAAKYSHMEVIPPPWGGRFRYKGG